MGDEEENWHRQGDGNVVDPKTPKFLLPISVKVSIDDDDQGAHLEEAGEEEGKLVDGAELRQWDLVLEPHGLCVGSCQAHSDHCSYENRADRDPDAQEADLIAEQKVFAFWFFWDDLSLESDRLVVVGQADYDNAGREEAEHVDYVEDCGEADCLVPALDVNLELLQSLFLVSHHML